VGQFTVAHYSGVGIDSAFLKLMQFWYGTHSVSRAVCPNCGSALEVSRGLSAPTLSCPNCSWSTSPTNTRRDEPHSSPEAFLKVIPGSAEAEYIFPGLLHIQPPRPIQWDWRLNLGFALLVLFALLIGISLISSTAPPSDHHISLPQAAIIVVIASLFLSPSLSKLKLLRNGDLAVGRVVYQQTASGNRHKWSFIFYAFVDATNRGFIGYGTDLTDTLAEGAPVLVYFDRSNPYKNVAMECSTLRVKQR
jgi:hypothetical protein